jgi:Flp pilus assembly protein TadG
MFIDWKRWMNNHRFQDSESGQSIIETAFLITVVLLLILAFVSVSSAYYYRTNMHYMTTNIGRVLSLSEVVNNPTQTQQEINDLLSYYENDILFPIHTSDPDRFTLTWEEQTFDLAYTMYSIQAEYRGLSIPFLDPIEIKVRNYTLKVEVEP